MSKYLIIKENGNMKRSVELDDQEMKLLQLCEKMVYRNKDIKTMFVIENKLKEIVED